MTETRSIAAKSRSINCFAATPGAIGRALRRAQMSLATPQPGLSSAAARIGRAFLPKPAQRNQPDPLPAILLGQLAVDRRYHGLGYARSLIWLALTTAVRFSKEVGCFGVLTHPLHGELRAFYRRFGFEDPPLDPNRAMIVRIVDLKRNGF